MFDNQNLNEAGSSESGYGAAPERSTFTSPIPKEKEVKEHPILKKLGIMLVGGVAFGLAAALVFIGIIKASGMDKALEAANSANDNVIAETTITHADESDAKEDGVVEDKENVDDEFAALLAQQQDKEYSVSEIAQSCMPSIVSITNKSVEEIRSLFGNRQYESTSAGSGIIIGQNDVELLIATNNHVVVNAKELSVCFGDDEKKVVEAKVKGTDPKNDLAIIAVDLNDLTSEIKSMITIAKIGKSTDVKIGDQVVAIGNALGYGQSVTTGIVSAKDREVTIEGMTAKLIQTDAAINPGNSGGALLNMKGELIGINSSKFASAVVEGMGYAIPIDTAEPILQDLMNRTTREEVSIDKQGFLGISCQNVSEEIAEMYRIPQGVYILETVEGGAADKAGIVKGDILTQFDGMTVTDYDVLKNNLKYYKVGEEVEVVIQRIKDDGGYEEKKVTVTLLGNPDGDIASQGSNDAEGDMEEQPQDGGKSPQDFLNDFFNYYGMEEDDSGISDFFFGR